MTAKDTTIAAWDRALQNRKYQPNLILHSDRGVQYACEAFRKKLAGTTVIQSMSRKGNCWDNAVAENFFKILKSELIEHRKYQTVQQAKLDIFQFIEGWYNRKRIHAYLGYLTPEQFSNLFYQNAA
jgi:transposase InsO family protein